MNLTETILKKIAPNAPSKNLEPFAEALTDTCEKYDINTRVRQLCFLSQLAHESGGFYYTEEIASGEAYEWRKDLGNTRLGDGVTFKGRGAIQITGRANYQALSKDLGVDFINNPILLGAKNLGKCTPDQVKYAALSAGWFWNKKDLNKFADRIDPEHPIDSGGNLTIYRELTRRINGGYNGLQDRIDKFKLALKAIPEPQQSLRFEPGENIGG